MSKANRGRAKTYDSDYLMIRSVMGIVLIALGILSIISIVGGIQGSVFAYVKFAMQGLGGVLCLGIPLLLIWGGVLVAFSAHRKPPVRAILFITVLYFGVLGIVNLLSKIGTLSLMEYTVQYNQGLNPPIPDADGYWDMIRGGYRICGSSNNFGGALGMIMAWPLWVYTGSMGGVAILSVLCLICVLFCSRFDIGGVIQRFRENTDERMERREVEKEKKAYLKQMKSEQETETAPVSETLQPAYQRRKGRPKEEAQATVTAPLAAQQAAYAGGMYADAYPAQAPFLQQNGMIPAQLPQTAAFVPAVQTSSAPLYDEMIVPELPDGGAVSGWKLKRNNAVKTSSEPKPAVVAPAGEATMAAVDRETAKLLQRMEENRKRKVEIDQRMTTAEPVYTGAAGVFSPLPAQPDVGADSRRKSGQNRKKETEQTDGRQGRMISAFPVEESDQPISHEDRVLTNRAAAYHPPEPAAEQPKQNPYATATQQAPADRFAAYRKPAETSDTAMMSGERLDKPNLKLPIQKQTTDKTNAPKPPKPYPYPMIELLNLRTQTLPDTRELDRVNAVKLEQTLESFGIPARVQRVTHGPAVTRFELGLVSSGINVKRIMNIADNIALDMAANGGVRIEVPIPGTNLFGVEVPNKEIISVSLAEVLTSPEMTNAKSPLSVALGKDIAGRPIICDLAKMPHLLIAGQTGSGKSVCINAIINSLLYRSSPEEVRMIMIDPKVVELQGYNRVPHLLIPVVSDPHKAAGALAWAVQEMLDRYHKMQSKGVREITAYNAKVTDDEPKLPRIVIIIDELSDLMLACKKEVEESIIRLAQLARAAGIHVVVATQRPTVNVITGLIKANIPSRIAFAVASSIDSRTILDMNGAEKLLGKGDMFYYPTGEKAPLRVQGCFLSDSEINNIVDYIGKNSETDYDERITEVMESPSAEDADNASDTGEDGDADDRLQEAIEMVLTDGQASISMLQRRMKIGYARAGRLIDDMAARGIVSKSAGSKPREVLLSYEQYLQGKDGYLR